MAPFPKSRQAAAERRPVALLLLLYPAGAVSARYLGGAVGGVIVNDKNLQHPLGDGADNLLDGLLLVVARDYDR